MNVTPSTTQTKRFDRSAHSSVLTKIAMRISMPPMVGVPALEKWRLRPVVAHHLADLAEPELLDHPRPEQQRRAPSPVITAKIARTVRYEKTLNPE